MTLRTVVAPHKLIWSFLIVLVLTTGCVAARQGESWPAVSALTLFDEQVVTVSYNDQINFVDPTNGSVVNLLNAEGEVRRDEQGNPRRFVVSGNNYDNAQFFARPVLSDNSDELLVATLNQRLLAIDPVTGTAESTTGISLPGQVIADVVPVEGVVYVPLKLGNLVALNQESGEVLWEVDTEAGVWSAPLIVDGMLYFGSIDHLVYAVDIGSGEVLWTQNLEGGVAATPAYHDGRIYAGSFSHKIFEMDAETGNILAEHEGNNWVWHTPIIADDVLYYADLSGYVHALDITNGLAPIWSVQVAERGIRAAPLVAGEDVLVASRDGKVYWLDRSTGTLVFDDEIEGRPEILADMVLLEPSETLDIEEPIVVVSTMNMGQLLVAFPLDYRSGYNGWTFAR